MNVIFEQVLCETEKDGETVKLYSGTVKTRGNNRLTEILVFYNTELETFLWQL